MTPKLFRKKVLSFYKGNSRSFPWRPPALELRQGKADPYKVLVSEVMLQQTQTLRVVPKYEVFLQQFPTLEALAKAPLSQVLKVWQGLGYNRRALFLHRAAQAALRAKSGGLPATYEELRALPGVGHYTASAVLAFAYNKPVVMLETNIRAALLHEFFPLPRRSLGKDGPKIPDKKLLPLLEKVVALSSYNSRELYYALMDYGAFLKQKHPNPSRRSAHHTRQSKFEGSDRQIRGHIIRALSRSVPLSAAVLFRNFGRETVRCRRILKKLIEEGLVARQGSLYKYPDSPLGSG
jgi:A/G-specific adenine glycosylase